jgi:hypothetical protein
MTHVVDRQFKRINPYVLGIEQMAPNLYTMGEKNAVPEPRSHVTGAAFASFPPTDTAQTVRMHPKLTVNGVLKYFIKTGD